LIKTVDDLHKEMFCLTCLDELTKQKNPQTFGG